MDSAEHLYHRWISDLWHGDFSVAEEILTPGFVGHWPAFDVHGPQGAAEQIRQSHGYFTDIQVTVDVGPIVADGLVAARWTFHGSYRGGIPGATAAPGTRVSFAGQDIFRVADGRFAEYWVVSDGLGMMSALGAR
ncbi:ester cyclase [Streptomyces sp. NPDC017056]|uniref:ester cyclase n=1 Tax=Streptomyces sp. NPDC017056 TaxID=3364973 RepID=UPI0037A63D53